MTHSSNISEVLLATSEIFIDEDSWNGLWWCRDAEDVQAVCFNAVCKSAYAAWDDVAAAPDCVEFIRKFRFVLVAVPPGPEQREIVRELSTRFQICVCVPKDEAWHDCDSVRELMHKSSENLDRLLVGCREIPINGILNIADLPEEEPVSKNRTFSGLPLLDLYTGGFAGGELSIWTGKRGEGKSTLLSQFVPEAVAHNKRVCIYSGEMPAASLKAILYQQTAGSGNIRRVVDQRTGKEIYRAAETVIPKLDRWMDKRVFITDIRTANAHDEDNILALFEYAQRRHRCSVFIVDNVMTAALKDEARLGQWRAQSVFAARLVAFAQRFDVHVHLVAHPRKTRDGNFDADDVAGTSDITNRASNVFRVGRIPEEKIDEVGCSAGIRVLKNRRYGDLGMIKLNFDPVTRRFYQVGGSPARKFDWEVSG